MCWNLQKFENNFFSLFVHYLLVLRDTNLNQFYSLSWIILKSKTKHSKILKSQLLIGMNFLTGWNILLNADFI